MSDTPLFSRLHVEATGEHPVADRLDLFTVVEKSIAEAQQARASSEQVLQALGGLFEQVQRIAGDIAEIRNRLG